MNPSICLTQISPHSSEYMVWCVLTRIVKRDDMIDKITMIPQTDKRGNSFQKAIVDFKQTAASEQSYLFFKKIMEGMKRVPCELRQHYWKVHFVPRPRIAAPVPVSVSAPLVPLKKDSRMAQA
jgi:hypothetical protein